MIYTLGLKWNIYNLQISGNNTSQVNRVSKDIPLKKQEINDLDIKVTIHHTDTVSAVIGCSSSPVILDITGVIIRLSNALAIIRERLCKLAKDLSGNTQSFGLDCEILWHFSYDCSFQ